MSGPICTHQSSPVDRKKHRQILERNIMDELVIAPLQKCRVNRQHRPLSLAGDARGKRHGMLLSNADIKITLGKSTGIFLHARSFAHRGCDGDDTRILLGHIAQPAAKNL